MPIKKDVLQSARDIAARLDKRATEIHEEYLGAKRKAEDLKAKFDMFNVAFDHLSNFKVSINGAYQCPRCWIERDRRSTLSPIYLAGAKTIFLSAGIAAMRLPFAIRGS